MRRTLAVALAAAVLLLPAAADAVIRPQRGMSGVWLGMSSTQVQAKLGRPIGRGGGRLYFARLWVAFRRGRAVEITTTRSTERTSSGLGVDSSESAVRAAYPGIACGSWSVYRRCRLGSGKPGTRVTDFTIGRGRVLQVTVALLPG